MTSTQQAEHQQKFQDHVRAMQQAQMEAMIEQRMIQMWSQKTQHDINTAPKQQYAAIAAVDLRSGFSKDGKIPWNIPEDLQWFKKKTEGHICVMGRATYEDLNERSTGMGAVLSNRKCFVVTSSDLPKPSAIKISNIGQLDKHLSEEDMSKTVFFIGGDRIYREGIAKCSTVYLSIVNNMYDCDKFFPTKYLHTHFDKGVIELPHPTNPDLRWVKFTRKQS